jgi:hypothetical protein
MYCQRIKVTEQSEGSLQKHNGSVAGNSPRTYWANLPVPAGDPNLPVQNRANLQLGSGALPRGNLRKLAAQNTKIG